MIKHEKCLVCGTDKVSDFLSCTDHFVSGESFELIKCSNCGFVFTQNIPSPEAIGPYYKSEEYISHSNTRKGLVNMLYHRVREIMLKKKLTLIKSISGGKRLLDVGCGIGYFPYYMQKNGYHAEGMEPDSDARNYAAENFNLQVNEPEQLLSEDIKDKYDVITLWHVMEHLHDTTKYLSWIFKALKSDGALFIALPNCSSYDARHFKKFWAAYDVPRHLWHFTPQTFEPYLKQFNFELIAVKRLPFDAYYNSLMSAKYRGDKLSLLSGFLTGFISNIKSLFSPRKTSSVIYVLQKAK